MGQGRSQHQSPGQAQHRATRAAQRASSAAKERLPKDLILLQIALAILSGGELTYQGLCEEYQLPRRTAERYLSDLRRVGIPIASERQGRQAVFKLAAGRSKKMQIEAVDISPGAARSLSLLLVAAALLPARLGVREAVDSTVRAALRLRGLKAATQLRRLEDAVMVLENDAKDYAEHGETFGTILDATLSGQRLRLRYRSPRLDAAQVLVFYSATVGLYKGGLYTLAVEPDDDGGRAQWRAVERIEAVLSVDAGTSTLPLATRQRALQEAKARWGPARANAAGEQVVTLHFSEQVALYVLARPWHPLAEAEVWPQEQGGGVRMAIRLRGDSSMFESWVRSWGAQVQVLRPAAMAKRIADSLEQAAKGHRAGPERWAGEINESEG